MTLVVVGGIDSLIVGDPLPAKVKERPNGHEARLFPAEA